MTEPGGSIGGVQPPRWSSFLAINCDKCIDTKTNRNQKKWRFLKVEDFSAKGATRPSMVRVSSESRKSQCAKAREVLTAVVRGDEGSTTLLKLKKPA
jgi:hypothetical protein